MRTLAALLAVISLAAALSAQQRAASNGYYPSGYSGDTWTGVVTSVEQSPFQITLTYTKGHKTQTFVGKPEKGYLVTPKNGPTRFLSPSDIHVGSKLTVYYMSERKKINGKKITVNTIFLIDSIPNNKPGRVYFMAFQAP